MPKFTQAAADQAYDIHSEFAKQVESARNDKTLSTTGRAQKIAAAWQQAQSGMEGLRVNFQGGQALTAQDIKTQVFGAQSVTGADAISVRDAYDRAAQVQNADEAAALLQQAQTTGDDHLARAIASTAYDNAGSTSAFTSHDPWSRMLNQYLATRPDVGAKLQQLTDAQSNTTKDSLDLAGWTYMVKPDEISRISDYQIELAANGQDPWDLTGGEANDTARAAMVDYWAAR